MKRNSINNLENELEILIQHCCEEHRAIIQQKSQALVEKYDNIEGESTWKRRKTLKGIKEITKIVKKCKKCKKKIKKNYGSTG